MISQEPIIGKSDQVSLGKRVEFSPSYEASFACSKHSYGEKIGITE